MGRTFAIGDIHGDLRHLEGLLTCLPPVGLEDTLVFLGDYLDRGPHSAQVIDFLRCQLPERTTARIVVLRGNHEDAWLKVRREGWIEFILPVGNGCLATLRSFTGGEVPAENEMAKPEEFKAMLSAEFFPAEVIEWMEGLPRYFEDEHAIYVHAGLPRLDDRWLHPSEISDTEDRPLLWLRSDEFFKTYQGKRVVFGHTTAVHLPQEMSVFTPDDPQDLFARGDVIGVDTGCGHGGFLTAIELPGLVVYESRRALPAVG